MVLEKTKELGDHEFSYGRPFTRSIEGHQRGQELGHIKGQHNFRITF